MKGNFLQRMELWEKYAYFLILGIESLLVSEELTEIHQLLNCQILSDGFWLPSQGYL